MCKPRLTLLTAALALLLLFPSPSRALIPLELVAEFQLPPVGHWDVQHCLNDSTYGWVCLDSDSLRYCLDVSDGTITACPNPPPNPTYPFFRGYRSIMAFGSGSQDNQTVVLLGYYEDYGVLGSQWGITRMALDPSEIIEGAAWIMAWGEYGPYCWLSSSVPEAYVWPPPPMSPAYLVFTLDREYDCDGLGWYGSKHSGFGNTINLSDSMMQTTWSGQAKWIHPFADFDSTRLLALSYHQEEEWSDMSWPPELRYRRSCAARQMIGDWEGPVDTTCWQPENDNCTPWLHQALVQAADGTRRAVYGNGECLVDSAGYFVTEWQNPSLTGSMISATLPGSGDERILQHRVGDFYFVYNASNGSYIDRTTAYEGAFQYVLKQPNRVSEFVTYEDSTRTIRIYCPGEALNVIITCDFDWLRLRWNRITGAQGYKIYATFPPIVNEWQPLATVIDTTWFFPIPAFDYGLYKVEPIY